MSQTELAVTPVQRRLRIAVLNRVFAPTGGGAERYSMALVEQLAQAHEIHVFAQQIDHAWPGVSYHKVSTLLSRPRWFNQLWYASATWWATRRGFDVVHSHENTWHGQVQTVHVLPVQHSLFLDRQGWRKAWRYLKVSTSPRLLAYLMLERLRFAPGRQRQVVVTSPSLEVVMAKTFAGCRLSVLAPGVSLATEPSDHAAARNQARTQLGLPLNGRLLAFVGNDYQKKGLPTLLEAMTRLPADVNLAVVGNPSHIERFRQQGNAMGLAGRVHFLGHLKDVSPLYRAADVLAHPTLEDTFAMVVLEAMAHGLPVVVSDARHCGIAGLLSDGVDAMMLSSPTDAGKLATTLLRTLDEPELRQQLSQGALAFAKQRSWPSVALQQERMYFELAQPGGPAMQLSPQTVPTLTSMSIVIPTWNNLALLKLCVSSVQSNSTYAHQIIIHVNDGSDGTLEWVRAQGLTYTHSQDNIGICLTVNQCAALAQHDLILYLNDDMYCCPQWDSKLLTKVQALGHDAFVLSGTMIEPVDSGNPCVSVADFGRDADSFDEAALLQRYASLKKADWYGATWPPTLVHRRWWHAVGGYSSEFSPGMASDNDFSMKMWAAGCRVFLGVGDSLVYHFMCKSTGRIVKNNGRKQFLRKWGMSSSLFDRFYLRRGQLATSTELGQPEQSSAFTRERWKSNIKAWLA